MYGTWRSRVDEKIGADDPKVVIGDVRKRRTTFDIAQGVDTLGCRLQSVVHPDGFRRSASFINAGTANMFPFDESRTQARTSESHGERIPSLPRADHDGIVLLCGVVIRLWFLERAQHLLTRALRQRQPNLKARISRFGADLNVATVLFDNALHRVEAKPGSFPHTFGGKERLENVGLNLG